MPVDKEKLDFIRSIVAQRKDWGSAVPMAELWMQTDRKGVPKAQSLRVSLERGGATLEGVFVEVWFRPTKILGENAKVSMSLIVDNTRALAIDADGVTGGHMNSVGKGMPFYQKKVGFPHIHFCVEDAYYGYAEPIDNVSIEILWLTFTGRANIQGAPNFELPKMQLEMPI